MIRIAIYARRSPDEDAHTAVQTQLAALRAHCAGVADWQVVTEIVDAGERGSDFNRDGIHRITALAQAGEIDAVIATSQDRFHRDDYKFEQLLRDVLRPCSVMPYTLTGPLSDETPMHWQARKAEGTYAETHARISGYKAKLGVRTKLQQGHYSKRPPVGYARGIEKQLIADPVYWPVVSEMFQRRAGGDGFTEIARDLNRRGLRTPHGKRWSQPRIRRIVTTLEYKGVVTLHGEVVKGPDGEPLTGIISPVIDADIWQAAQPAGDPGRRPAMVYLLSGLLYAPQWVTTYPPADEGIAARYTGAGGVYRLQRNELRTIEPRGDDLLAQHLKRKLCVDWIEGVVLDVLEGYANSIDDLLVDAAHLGTEELAGELKDKRGTLLHQLAHCESELAQCQDDLIKAVRQEVTTVVKRLTHDEAQIESRRDDLNGQLAEIDAQLQALESQPDTPAASEQINLIGEARQFDNRQELRHLLRGLLDHVDVTLEELPDTYEVTLHVRANYTQAVAYVYLRLAAVYRYSGSTPLRNG